MLDIHREKGLNKTPIKWDTLSLKLLLETSVVIIFFWVNIRIILRQFYTALY